MEYFIHLLNKERKRKIPQKQEKQNHKTYLRKQPVTQDKMGKLTSETKMKALKN